MLQITNEIQTMTPKEILLASKMLNEYADRLGNNCCNDWEWPEDWTHEERRLFIKQMHDLNGDPEEFLDLDESHDHIPDFCVAWLLSEKLKSFLCIEESK